MNLIDRLSTMLGVTPDDKVSGCRAVVGESPDSLCSGPAWGRGTTQGHTIYYCKSHAPSAAVGMACSGRVNPVTFHIPEIDDTIEVK